MYCMTMHLTVTTPTTPQFHGHYTDLTGILVKNCRILLWQSSSDYVKSVHNDHGEDDRGLLYGDSYTVFETCMQLIVNLKQTATNYK